MKFPQAFIDEVRAAADIVTVISDHVSLRKAGTSFKGLCPFHGEKTASFNVNRERGFFHCFGCGVGGDVFKFVELQETVGFTDAVRQLAQRFGIPIPELEGSDENRESASEREAMLRAHEIAAAYFQEQLASPAGVRTRDYLLGARGLTAETIARLELGWAPPARDGLRQQLARQGIPAPLMIRSGLISRRDDGTELDRFRNRLMVPIARDTGSIIAFGGRALDRDQQPKYLNSPETPIYTKSRTLYGLNLTKADLKKSAFTVIVEGYFDFAQVFQSGGLPVVATCGTALTPAQAQMLRRFAPKAVLCFDPDQAGQSAAERSCELLVSEGFSVNVALLPDGEDPDTFLQKHGREAFVTHLQQSKPYLEFLLDRAAAGHDLTRDDSRRELLRKMLGVAARIPDPAVRDQFADRLSHKARVTEEVVRAEIRKAAAARKTELPAERLPGLTGGRVRGAERGLIWGIVHEPAAVLPWLNELEPEDMEGLSSRDVLVAARAVAAEGAEDVPSVLLGRLSTRDAQLVAAIAAEREPPVLSAESCVHALKASRVRRDLGVLQEEIAQVRRQGPTGPMLLDLLRRKNELRSALERSSRKTAEGL